MANSYLTPNHDVAFTAEAITNELSPGGVLFDVAQAKVNDLPADVTPTEVSEIILPEPAAREGSGVVLESRWSLVKTAEAEPAVRKVNAINRDRIFKVAASLGMRKLIMRNGEWGRDLEAPNSIDPLSAVVVVEGGGNKTSVVRRGVAEKTMREMYGDELANFRVVQFGSGRQIDATRKDGSANPEHATIRGLAPDLLPLVDSFSEFSANLATALADGYEVDKVEGESHDGLIQKRYVLRHADQRRPVLDMIQPTGPRLDEALDTLSLAGTDQLVVATNGQYRPKADFQTQLWARERGIKLMPTVAIGDEPGDTFAFAGGEIVVPDRPEAAYVNDMVVLGRLATRLLANPKRK